MATSRTRIKQGRTKLLVLATLLTTAWLLQTAVAVAGEDGGIPHDDAPGDTLAETQNTSRPPDPTASDLYGICAERGPAFNTPLIARFQIAITKPAAITKLTLKTESANIVALEIPYNNWTVDIANGIATGTASETPDPYNTFWFWVGIEPNADTGTFIDISAIAYLADGSTISHTLSPDSPPTTNLNSSLNSDTQFQMLRLPYNQQTTSTLPANQATGTTAEPCLIDSVGTTKNLQKNEGVLQNSLLWAGGAVGLSIIVFFLYKIVSRRNRRLQQGP